MIFMIKQNAKSISKELTPQEKRLKRAKLYEGIGWTVLAFMAFIASLFISIKVSAEAIDSENGSGVLFLNESKSAMHIKTEVSAFLSGLTANVKYIQHFKNDSDNWQEAVYVFPLPENAAVNYFKLSVGEKIIIGEIKEKQEAQKIYKQAKSQGKKTALLNQQRNNLFRQKIANIAPQEELQIEIHYLQEIAYQLGRFEWRLPTTLTPRYIPGAPLNSDNSENNKNVDQALDTNLHGWATATVEVPDAAEITPHMVSSNGSNKGLTIDIELDAGLPLAEINALYHEIAIQKVGPVHKVSFSKVSEAMDRDLVLHWRPVATEAPVAAVFQESISGSHQPQVDGDYVQIMVLPPEHHAEANTINRDMIFVIDTSGSMQGASIVQAKNSLNLALNRLVPGDRFNIVEFNSRHTQLFDGLREADAANISLAKSWVNKLYANGGTEMYSALKAAFEMNAVSSNNIEQVVFITDGAVGNESQLIKLIHKQLADARLFTVGIGSAPNSYFMKKAAEFGRGSYTFIGDVRELEKRMDELFVKLESVVSSHHSVDWPQEVEVFPKRVPDLYAGEPLLLTAKINGLQGEVRIGGVLGGGVVGGGVVSGKPWQQTISLNPGEKTNSGIATLWARQKIESLENQIIEGREPQEVREEVLPLALAHKLVTAYTSFVAVDKEPPKPLDEPLHSASVPNLTPKGLHVSQHAYPSTATPMQLHFILGALMSLIALGALRWRQQ